MMARLRSLFPGLVRDLSAYTHAFSLLLTLQKHLRKLHPASLCVWCVLAAGIAGSSLPGGAQSCTGLQCQQVTCPLGGTTSISGKVYAPNGADPIPGVIVYIPNGTVQAFTDGVNLTSPNKEDAATLVTGSPLVQATTAADGSFTLTNVPVGTNIPLVIQAGRWRRQLTVASTSRCANTALAAGFASFPSTHAQGDIPKMALVTGSVDALECTLYKMGIAQSEFTAPNGTGRVQLFQGAASSGVTPASGTQKTEIDLLGTPATLDGYNIVLLPCQGNSSYVTGSGSYTGSTVTKPTGRADLIAFAGAGGRVFATHYSGQYLSQDSTINGAANWSIGGKSSMPNDPDVATINTNFSSGMTMAQWLQSIGSTTTQGAVSISTLRLDQTGVNAPTVPWVTYNASPVTTAVKIGSTTITSPVMQFSFYTPVGAATSAQYGRVMFNEYHVDNASTSSSTAFPNECTGSMAQNASMSAQEHMLEYSLFDLMNFALPVIAPTISLSITPTPSTFVGGDNADTILVDVTNTSSSAAIAISPTVSLTLSLPTGLTPESMVDPSGYWSCTASSLTCTLQKPLPSGSLTSVTLTVGVAANVATGTQTVGATVGSTGFSASVSSPLSLAVHVAAANVVTGPSTTTATTTAVGSTTSAAATASIAISAGSSIGTIAVVTQGATGLDFALSTAGTCQSSHTYATATSCTLAVDFSPKAPGLRLGAIEIFSSTGTLLDTVYISGVGQASQATLQPGAITSLSAGTLSAPRAIAVDAAGNVYIASTGNSEVIKIPLGGSAAVFAGTGTAGYNNDGIAAASAELNQPMAVVLDGAGNLYIADTANHIVRKVSALTGVISTFAGNRTQGYSGDGSAATSAKLGAPSGLAVDVSGNLYITDQTYHVVREVSETSGVISTVAGTGTANYSGDGALATAATLDAPTALALDSAGNLYITDAGNNVVRMVLASSGVISTVAGNGTSGHAGDGAAATSAELNTPSGIGVDAAGNVYIAEAGAGSLRMVSAATSTIATVGGGGSQTTSSTALSARSAQLATPAGLALDGAGNLYLTEQGNNAVDKITAAAASLAYPTPTQVSTSDTTDGIETLTLLNSGNQTLSAVAPGLSAATDFTQQTGGANDCSTTFSLASGANCQLRFAFTPTQTGSPLSESFVATSNSMNTAAGVAATLTLSGTARTVVSADATATAVSVTPSSPMVGQAVTIAATVTDTTNGGATVATGAVSFTDTVNSVTTNLNSGTAVQVNSSGVATLSGVALSGSAGTQHLITANYAGVSNVYTASSGTSATITLVTPTAATATAPTALDLGSVAVGSSASGTLSFTLASAGVIGAPIVLTRGVTGLDFVDAGTGSCTTNGTTHVYSAGDLCTVAVTFTPAYPGEIDGAVELVDGSGNLLATAYLHAIGIGALAGFSPASVTTPSVTGTIPASLSHPTVDAQNQLYVADATGNQVVKLVPNSGAYTGSVLLGSWNSGAQSLSSPVATALDGAGNLYVADQGNNRVVERLASGVVQVLSTGSLSFNASFTPGELAVDGTGTLYVADKLNNRVLVFAPGAAPAVLSVNGVTLGAVEGIAADTSGLVYMADATNNQIVRVPSSGGTGTVLNLNGLTLAAPRSLTLDAAGNLYMADTGNNRIVLLPYGSSHPLVLSQGTTTLSGPAGVAVVRSADLLIADSGNARLVMTSQSVAPSLSFSNTTVGQTSADQNVALLDLGTAGLVFSVPATGNNPSLSSGFGMDTTTCPAVAAGGSEQILAANNWCQFALNFAPTTTGSASGSLILTDNSTTSSPQTIGLSGTGLASPISIAPASGTPTALTGGSYGSSYTQTFTASGGVGSSYAYAISAGALPAGLTLSSSGVLSGTPAATGAFTFTVQATDSQSNTGTQAYALSIGQGAATVAITNLTQTYTGSPLAVTVTTTPANLTVTTTYTGTNGTSYGPSSTAPTSVGSYSVTSTVSDANYTGTHHETFTITQAAQQINFPQPTTPVVYGVAPFALSATGGGSGNAVTFSVVSGPAQLNGSTLSIVGVGTVVVAADQAGNANYTAATEVQRTIVVLPAGLGFNASALAFGSEPVGQTSATQTIILSNLNNTAIALASLTATGDFSAISSCAVIPAAGACTVNVSFTPTALGARSGSLVVSGAQSGSPQSIPLSGTGTEPGISITPSTLVFGSQIVASTSLPQSITIANTGTAALTVTNITASGDFAVSSNCGTVPAGTNCSLMVTFTPTATGTRTGTITFTDNAGTGTQNQVIQLSGSGTSAGATLTPASLSFPSTLLGTTSFGINATLTNSGSAALTGITAQTVGDYSVTSSCGATLAAGASCTLNLRFTPTVSGADTGSLVVSDSVGTQTLVLTGTGLAPGAALSTAQLIFGSQQTGTTSLAQTVAFTNSGNAPVSVTSIAASANFTETDNCTGTVAAGASCNINIAFAPGTTGALSGTVTVVDSAGTQVITAQGQGVAPGLSVNPAFVIFGAEQVNTASQAQSITVTNSGSTTLTLKPIMVSSNFTEADQCSTLAPGASCLVSVAFAPASTGAIAGALVVSDTGGQVSTQATLSGQGTLPGIAAAPSNLSFGSVTVSKTSEAQTITLTNSGTAPLQIGSITASGDFAETDTCASSTLAAGSYCVISVTMTPTTMGTRTGTIQIINAADGAHTVALSGVGQQAGVSIYPTSLAFGSMPYVALSQVSLTTGTVLSVNLTNTGNVPLTLGGATATGDFHETDSCGGTVAVGAACTLTVRFVPTASGHRTGTLTITDNAGGGTQTVTLAGDGSPGGLTLTPPTLDFGVQTIGQTSQSQTAKLTNLTGGSLTGLTMIASGEFTETDTCNGTLANGASCTLLITVTPQTPGAVTGSVDVNASIQTSGGSTTRAMLAAMSSGGSISNVGVVAVKASAVPPGVGLSIPKLSFSVTSVGAPSTGQTLTLTNTGTGLSLTNLAFNDTNATEFPETTTCGATLAAQASCTITLHFTPTGVGLRTSTLQITADGGISAALPLDGTAVAPVAQLVFTIPPAPSLQAGGNAGAAVTVTEEDGTGTASSSYNDTILLSVSGPSNYHQSYSAVANAGAASFNLANVPLATAGSYTYTAAIGGASTVPPVTAGEIVANSAAATVTATAGSSQSALINAAFGTPLSVRVADSYGNPINGATVIFTAPASGASGTVTPATAVTNAVGVASASVVANGITGSYSVKATVSGGATASFALTNAVASSSSAVTTNLARSTYLSGVTFTAAVSSASGTPTGTVTFTDGGTAIGTGILNGGVATYSTSALAAGNHNIAAVYTGDGNFAASNAASIPQVVVDFTLAPVGASGASQDILPGATGSYVLALTPTSGTSMPLATTLTVTGLPAGVTATLAPGTWTALGATSWQLPAATTLSNLTLSVTASGQTAQNERHDSRAPLLLALLLLPFAARLRRTGRKLTRWAVWLLAAVLATLSLSACGTPNGFFGQAPATTTLTVTATTGNLSHSTQLTLKVE